MTNKEAPHDIPALCSLHHGAHDACDSRFTLMCHLRPNGLHSRVLSVMPNKLLGFIGQALCSACKCCCQWKPLMQSGTGCLHHRDQCPALLRESRADSVVHEKGGEKKSAQLSLAQKSTNCSLTLYAQSTGEMSVARTASLAFTTEGQR